jgi:AraC family transcriptional regulator
MASFAQSLPPSNAPLFVTMESEWRRLAKTSPNAALPDRIVASRWIDERTQPREENIDHGADHYMICLALRSTNLDVVVEGRTTHTGPVQCGMIQICAPGVRATALLRAPCDFLHLRVAIPFLTARYQELGVLPWRHDQFSNHFGFGRDTAITTLTQAILDARTPAGELCTEYVNSIALAIVTRLAMSHEVWRVRDRSCRVCELPKWRLKRAVDYVEAHLAEPIQLCHMANAAGLSRMHFAAQFRAATGVRPREYLLRRRIERAKDLLASADLTLVDIAMSIGFANQSHFSTVFGRIEGQAPGRWRRENRSISVVQNQKNTFRGKTQTWSASDIR